MGHSRRSVAHVYRLEDHQAGVQGDLTEQKDYCRRSGQIGNPGSKDLQGQLLIVNTFLNGYMQFEWKMSLLRYFIC